MKVEVHTESPLRWPKGWPRTLIDNRESKAVWKKPFIHYRDAVVHELSLMKVSSVTITYNNQENASRDPGVAVWFSIQAIQDWSWQSGLQIDSPVPSLEEIDDAYKRLARKHHPDAVANGSGGDVQQYNKLSDYRKKARAWVLGEDKTQHGNCIPMDRFREARLNLAGIRAALAHFRGLERLGMPAMDYAIEHGVRVPEDMAIIGCGNLHYDDSLRVGLSSIDQHSRRIGEAAARIALGILGSQAPPAPETVILQPELVIRASTRRKAHRRGH
jgi:hypothetical protein